MKPDIKIDITVGALRAMNATQLQALQNNVLADGNWETADGLRISGGGDCLGVEPMRHKRVPHHSVEMVTGPLERLIFLGIEKDGYTHS